MIHKSTNNKITYTIDADTNYFQHVDSFDNSLFDDIKDYIFN